MIEGEPKKPAQFIFPSKEFESLFSDANTYYLFVDNKRLLVTEPVGPEEVGWKVDFYDSLVQPVKIPTLKETKSNLTLGGYPIYLDKAVNPERDELVVNTLEMVRSAGGGIIIYLDPRDWYGASYEDESGDRDYHYALTGIDLSLWPEHELGPIWEDEEIRDYYGSQTIPLPMLAERLGFVEVENPEIWTDEELKQKNYTTRLTTDFTGIVKVLSNIFNGNVKLGIRMDRDPLYAWSYPYDYKILPTDKNVRALYSGPFLPRSVDDEERIAFLQQWLLKLDERFNKLFFSKINAGNIFFRLMKKKMMTRISPVGPNLFSAL